MSDNIVVPIVSVGAGLYLTLMFYAYYKHNQNSLYSEETSNQKGTEGGSKKRIKTKTTKTKKTKTRRKK
jgi:hypothetical protein